MAKKKNKKINPFILMLIYASLIFALYISLSTWTLVIFGDSVLGTVDSYQSRLDDITSETNKSRTISKGYYFIVDNKEYNGHIIYNSDELWPDLEKGETRSERITYLPIFPYINKPSMLVELDEMGTFSILYHIIAPIGYIFLFSLVDKTNKRTKKG
ncbi:MAG: hypothetical protein PHU94_01130 [Bacilli bacterium]|nr:hypothetical protein [Bacilli bacterium]MDD4733313.1 hypothetical protein [Bacilli bacterium]